MNEQLAPAVFVITVLEKMDIPYFVGGSIASATYGESRTTLDADIIANLSIGHITPLQNALKDHFYIDTEMIADAIKHRGRFNLLHLDTMFKIDIFIPQERAFTQSQFERRQKLPVDSEGRHSIYLASPEDVILAKLEWYRAGNEVSERQWNDVIGIIKTQAGALDRDYLRLWAVELSVGDLLDRALGHH